MAAYHWRYLDSRRRRHFVSTSFLTSASTATVPFVGRWRSKCSTHVMFILFRRHLNGDRRVIGMKTCWQWRLYRLILSWNLLATSPSPVWMTLMMNKLRSLIPRDRSLPVTLEHGWMTPLNLLYFRLNLSRFLLKELIKDYIFLWWSILMVSILFNGIMNILV